MKRYEKAAPGEMVHFDTKKLPVMYGEAITQPKEWLHVAIDDFSRMLVADIGALCGIIWAYAGNASKKMRR